ncbi:MAG: RNA-binding cell elongation regulator Jag/EloR [Eubacteriales bacterium]
MLKEIVASGKDILEAKENARLALGATEMDDVTFEILHAGSKGVFGLFAKPAQVKASMEIPDPQPRRDRRDNKGKPNQYKENTPSKPPRQAPEAPMANRPSNQPKKGSKKPGNQDNRNAPKKDNRPKPVAVFETELRFTRLEVEEGEDRAFDFVRTLVSNMGIEAEVQLLACDDGSRRVNIVGQEASALIGHRGETLDAVQYLANLAYTQKNSRGEKNRLRVTVDIEGYRAKREETLRTLARSMAAKALRNKKNVLLEPMSSYERRIIHSEVQGIEGVTTYSVGSDNNRKIVISVSDKKNQLKPQDSATAPQSDADPDASAWESETAAPESSQTDAPQPEETETASPQDTAPAVQEESDSAEQPTPTTESDSEEPESEESDASEQS